MEVFENNASSGRCSDWVEHLNSPRISVLIVTYNSGKYLEKTLRSVFDQSFQDFEVQILDNGSSDGTKEYLKNISSPRCFVHFSEKNLWPYQALNLLLEKSRGEYIAIQDHDDIWFENKLAEQIAFLDSHPEYQGCWTAVDMFYEADATHFVYKLPAKNWYALHPSVLYRNTWALKYDTSIDYMSDAYFLKFSVCSGEKKLYNLDSTLMRHIIKDAAWNYSYRWFKLDKEHIQRIFQIHWISLYSFAVLAFELQRKVFYPILNRLQLYSCIAQIEKIPFRLLGNTIKKTT